MRLYRLEATQQLPIPPETAWEFLSNPANLQKITPPDMGFEILSGAERPMYAGQLIQYTVSPFPGVRTRWMSEITHVTQGSYFVDEQRYGPYSLWHHKHFIREIEGGVVMEDIVDYKLPLGILGHIAQGLFVRRQLMNIFKFREDALKDLYGSFPGRPAQIKIKTI